MYDLKVQYLTNTINIFDNHGYDELTQYDKYYIILTIIEMMTYSFNCYLGPFVKRLELPSVIHNEYPILGMSTKGEYEVPSLYNMSLCVVQRYNIYSNNLHYNKLIAKSKFYYMINDNSNMLFQYFMSVYSEYPEFIISLLIDRYKIHSSDDYLENISSDTDTDTDSEEIDYPDETSDYGEYY